MVAARINDLSPEALNEWEFCDRMFFRLVEFARAP